MTETSPPQHGTEHPTDGDDRYRLLVESIRNCAILMLDVNGRVASWNTVAQRIKGDTDEEILGQHLGTAPSRSRTGS